MQYRNFKGQNISLLGFGCMRFPVTDKANCGAAIDKPAAQELIDAAFEAGVNYFDTAYPYHGGNSETFMREALKKHPRSSYYLADKMPGWLIKTPADAERIFNEQLKKCGTDYFDFYLCHALNRDAWAVYADFLLDFLKQKKESGKIKYLGFSFHSTPAMLKTIVKAYGWDFAQLQINYLDWQQQKAKEQYEILEKNGIPVIVMEPVRGGLLANLPQSAADVFMRRAEDKSQASWALRYVMNLKNVFTVLSGMSDMQQVLDNVKTAAQFSPFTEEDYQTVELALSEFKKAVTIPCTSCHYCRGCKVDIAKNFEIFNYAALSKDIKGARANYRKLNEAVAASCTECGECELKCPQGIDIRKELKRVAESFDESNP